MSHYESEISNLRASNKEQTEDLRAMIKTVSELKQENRDLADQLRDKRDELEGVSKQAAREAEDLKRNHNQSVASLKAKHKEELDQYIEQVNQLEEHINSFEASLQGPKSQFLRDLADKTQQISTLTAKLNQKNGDVL